MQWLLGFAEGGHAPGRGVIQMRSLPAREEQFPIIRTFDDYLCYMDESLQIDMLQMGKLVAQVSNDKAANARQIVSGWVIVGEVKQS